ncbi:unnamed protein product [Amoebophrya sp. A120]|nr:unnamed protein product [Amoebophrya sp. A120]|eukprot:GSA120T00009064001.1
MFLIPDVLRLLLKQSFDGLCAAEMLPEFLVPGDPTVTAEIRGQEPHLEGILEEDEEGLFYIPNSNVLIEEVEAVEGAAIPPDGRQQLQAADGIASVSASPGQFSKQTSPSEVDSALVPPEMLNPRLINEQLSYSVFADKVGQRLQRLQSKNSFQPGTNSAATAGANNPTSSTDMSRSGSEESVSMRGQNGSHASASATPSPDLIRSPPQEATSTREPVSIFTNSDATPGAGAARRTGGDGTTPGVVVPGSTNAVDATGRLSRTSSFASIDGEEAPVPDGEVTARNQKTDGDATGRTNKVEGATRSTSATRQRGQGNGDGTTTTTTAGEQVHDGVTRSRSKSKARSKARSGRENNSNAEDQSQHQTPDVVHPKAYNLAVSAVQWRADIIRKRCALESRDEAEAWALLLLTWEKISPPVKVYISESWEEAKPHVWFYGAVVGLAAFTFLLFLTLLLFLCVVEKWMTIQKRSRENQLYEQQVQRMQAWALEHGGTFHRDTLMTTVQGASASPSPAHSCNSRRFFVQDRRGPHALQDEDQDHDFRRGEVMKGVVDEEHNEEDYHNNFHHDDNADVFHENKALDVNHRDVDRQMHNFPDLQNHQNLNNSASAPEFRLVRHKDQQGRHDTISFGVANVEKSYVFKTGGEPSSSSSKELGSAKSAASADSAGNSTPGERSFRANRGGGYTASQSEMDETESSASDEEDEEVFISEADGNVVVEQIMQRGTESESTKGKEKAAEKHARSTASQRPLGRRSSSTSRKKNDVSSKHNNLDRHFSAQKSSDNNEDYDECDSDVESDTPRVPDNTPRSGYASSVVSFTRRGKFLKTTNLPSDAPPCPPSTPAALRLVSDGCGADRPEVGRHT